MRYQTNCTPTGVTVSVELTDVEVSQLYQSYGDGQGFLLEGYFLEEEDLDERVVGDYSGFGFIPNPYQENTHIFNSYDGVFICSSPADGERHKYQKVLRMAEQKELNFYLDNI